MRKLIATMAAVSALGVAVPALAQDFTYRADQAQDRIDAGVRDGSLTWYEARDLRSRLSDLRQLEARYEESGMRGWQQRELDRRFDALNNDVYAERHNNQYRYERRNDDY